MHEFSTMAAMVRGVLEAAGERKAARILEVRLSIGELTFLAEGQLRTAYSSLTRGTIAEGSSLVIDVVEGRISCRECGFEGPPGESSIGERHFVPLTLCPKCGGVSVVTAGKECLVSGAEVELTESK